MYLEAALITNKDIFTGKDWNINTECTEENLLYIVTKLLCKFETGRVDRLEFLVNIFESLLEIGRNPSFLVKKWKNKNIFI